MSNQMFNESLKYLHTLQLTVKCSKPSVHTRNLKVQNPHLHLKNNPEIIPLKVLPQLDLSSLSALSKCGVG